MNYLYLLLDGVVLLPPLILSFEQRMNYYRQWIPLFIAILFIGSIFIFSDIVFTKYGIWGFHKNYLIGIFFFGLPFEEVLFFVVVPFASIFIHDSLVFQFPSLRAGKRITVFTSITIVIFSLVVFLTFAGRLYTQFSALLVIITTLIGLKIISLLQHFFISFLINFLPFFLMNSVLTGGFLQSTIVWYNPDHITGLRLYTIPLEDIGYCYGLLLSILLLRKYIMRNIDLRKQVLYV